MKYFQEGKSNWKVRNRANYMNKLTRNQASTIFKTRTRMLKVKSNYKNGNKDLTCRMCGKHEETQDHILEECESINKDHPPVTKALIFSDCIKELRKAAECITKRMEILENKNIRLPPLHISSVREFVICCSIGHLKTLFWNCSNPLPSLLHLVW